MRPLTLREKLLDSSIKNSMSELSRIGFEFFQCDGVAFIRNNVSGTNCAYGVIELSDLKLARILRAKLHQHRASDFADDGGAR